MNTNKHEQEVGVTFHGEKTNAHVTVYGDPDKPQLLCLHGIGSTGSESFDNIADHLGGEFQLVAPDWIGFGKSSRLLGKSDTYSSGYCTEWLATLIETAQRNGILNQTFDILAHSMSALAVAKFFERMKTHFRKIVFINPAGMETKINRIFSFFLTSPHINQRTLAKFTIHPLIWFHVLHWSKSHRNRLIDGLQDGEFDVLVRYAKAGINPNGTMKLTNVIPEAFEKISAPILVIASSHDSIFFKRKYLDIARSHGWQIREIQIANHHLLTRESIRVADCVRSFLNE